MGNGKGTHLRITHISLTLTSPEGEGFCWPVTGSSSGFYGRWGTVRRPKLPCGGQDCIPKR